MKVLFFKENVGFAKEFLLNHKDSIAFWYMSGLYSYSYLNKVYEIESIYVEEKVVSSFKKDYPEFEITFKIETFPSVENPKSHKPLCFLASNDTIAKSYENILNQYNQDEYQLFCKPNENAKMAADQMGIHAEIIGLKIPSIEKFSALIVCNDWGLTERKINQDFLELGKNTICLQESSIDFNDHDKRMRFCSIPVFQGIASLQNIDMRGKICAVIGNPRFEGLRKSPLPPFHKALINVNFTYGIFEEARDQWVADILSACSGQDIDYVISQHPRDRGDFSKLNLLKSNPSLVHGSIRDSSVVISRFSALLTEAVCLGRPAIYYNPHGEKVQYKFEPDNKMFFYATNKSELVEALEKIKEYHSTGDNEDLEFVKKHLGVTSTGEASKFINRFLQHVAVFPPLKTSSLMERMIVSLSILKRILRKQNY